MLNLIDQAELLEMVIDWSCDAIVLRDLENRILLWNRGAELAYGWSQSEALGRNLHTLLHTEWPYGEEEVTAQLHCRGYWEGELFHITGSSELVTAHSRQILHRGLRGGSFVILQIDHDITRVKQAEMKAQDLMQKPYSIDRDSTVAELMASLSHELNQPLTAILTYTQAAQRLLKSNKSDFEVLGDILANIASCDLRAEEVIRRLRYLFKKDNPQKQLLDLNDIVTETSELMRSETVGHGVEVICKLTPNLPSITGDRIHLQQVVVNLMMNAVDAMKDSVEVDRRLTVGTIKTEDHRIELFVQDNGPGIPADRLQQLFKPFFTTKPDGMGIGLTVCHSIMEAHNGRIWAENNATGGATFRFSLPIEE